MSGIGRDGPDTNIGIGELHVFPVDIIKVGVEGQLVAEEVEVGAHLVVPTVFGVIALFVLGGDAPVESARFIAARHRCIVFVACRGEILCGELRGELSGVERLVEIIGLLRRSRLVAVGEARVAAVRVLIIEPQSGSERQSSPHVVTALVVYGEARGRLVIVGEGTRQGRGLLVLCLTLRVLVQTEDTRHPLVSAVGVRLRRQLLRHHALMAVP